MRTLPALALILLAGCSQAAADTPWDRAKKAKGAAPPQRVRVIDGDTLVLNGETIRIENIDAPEKAPKSKCLAESALAYASTRALTEFTVWPLTVERSGRDRYGRTLARVTLTTPSGNPSDLGEIMMTAGYAARWNGHRRDWCSPQSVNQPDGPFTGDPRQADAELKAMGF